MIKKTELFEPSLERTNGFFRYLFRSLRQCANARPIDDPRPVPKVEKPRVHESAWIRCDGHLIFFDMSDHVFFFDFDALKVCSVYFKTNLNGALAQAILNARGYDSHRLKLQPFFSFAGNLHLYNPGDWRNRVGVRQCRKDVCHIVGLYENLLRNEESPPAPGEMVSPAQYHYWIRVQTNLALQKAGMSGYYRLTSRGNKAIEDDLIRPNISQRAYMRHMLACRFTVINTLPHALPPWKVTESIAMLRPFVVERKPLIEFPDPFKLEVEKHYIELLPDWGAFDESADIDDEKRYRVLQYPGEDRLLNACERLKMLLADRDIFVEMSRHIEQFARYQMTPGNVAEYVHDQVNALIH